MSKFYYHGVQGNEYDMLKILKDGEIKSLRLQGSRYYTGLNGLDYVCICNKLSDSYYEDSEGYEKAFDVFIKNCFSFIISDNIDVIKCNVMKKLSYLQYRNSLDDLDINLDIGLHITDMIDEYRVKDKIPKDKIIGICIPFDKLEDYDMSIVYKIIELARKRGYDVIDSSKNGFIEEYENNKSLTKKR